MMLMFSLYDCRFFADADYVTPCRRYFADTDAGAASRRYVFHDVAAHIDGDAAMPSPPRVCHYMLIR